MGWSAQIALRDLEQFAAELELQEKLDVTQSKGHIQER